MGFPSRRMKSFPVPGQILYSDMAQSSAVGDEIEFGTTEKREG